MDYMYKLFYKMNNKERQEEYSKRINSPNVEIINFIIKPYKSSEKYNLYYIPTSQILNLVKEIEKNNAKLILHIINLPNVATKSLHQDIIVNELMSTNQIEGVKSSKEEFVQSMKEINDKSKKVTKTRFKSMVNSYLNILYKNNSLPKEPKDIKKIYEMIAKDEVSDKDKLDGKLFRKETVNVVTSTNKIIHEGVNPHNKIVKELQVLLNFLNTPSEIVPIIRIAIAHYYMGYIHPFYDGNGRTSRYMTSLYLSKEYHELTAISLSRSIDNNKKTYYEMFDKTNKTMNKGELNYFIDNFLKFIRDGQKALIEELRIKKASLDDAYDIIKNDNKLQQMSDNHKNIMFILAQIYNFSLEEAVTVQQMSDFLEVSQHTARKLLNELVSIGYVNKEGTKPIYYKVEESYFF